MLSVAEIRTSNSWKMSHPLDPSCISQQPEASLVCLSILTFSEKSQPPHQSKERSCSKALRQGRVMLASKGTLDSDLLFGNITVFTFGFSILFPQVTHTLSNSFMPPFLVLVLSLTSKQNLTTQDWRLDNCI